ncbi:hypothetical protein [Nostoc sp.]|uniref:hypothetical protein n=1 Tax=Nostoc sp. TaxID=1180 RepID=UPI002FF7BA33
MSNKLAIAISDGCANAKGERLSSSWGFSRILYQKALEIAQLSLEVNHPNAMFLLCVRPWRWRSHRCWNWLKYSDFSFKSRVKQEKICNKIPQGVPATLR